MWKDSETELDFLDFNYLINILKDTINDEKLLPASIGVYGDWGSGKSSLMFMCKKRLEEEDADLKCIVFNGWLFEGYDDAKSAIMGSILDSIAENRVFSQKAKKKIEALYKSVDKLKLTRTFLKYGLDFYLTGGVGTLIDTTAKAGKKFLDGDKDKDVQEIQTQIKDELENKKLRNDIRTFQKQFVELLEETKISKLVIFIDELDRCNPDTILDTLEAMRLFLFSGKVAFVIGADERHIAYAVRKKFIEIEGIQIDIGKEYLEKLIQYPIRIPKLNSQEVEFYIFSLLLQDELGDFEFAVLQELLSVKRQENFMNFSIVDSVAEIKVKDDLRSKATRIARIAQSLASALTQGLNGNPRQCKRFLNSLDMRLKMAKYKGKELEQKILAKIMMLEYIRPSLFQKMAQLSFNGTLGKELVGLESGKGVPTDTFDIWKDDEWLKKWCLIDPALANKDLGLYFYFSRTSIDERANLISSKLSTRAQEIYRNLISQSEITRKKALEEAHELSEVEAAKILELIYSSKIMEDKIEKNDFNLLLELGATKKSLYGETLEYLKNINGKNIKISFALSIGKFIKQTNLLKETKLITDKWVKENSKLKKSFDTEYEKFDTP